MTDISPWKLQPIYDLLDADNPKAALVQCQKILKKQPNASMVKALKALALQRLGMKDEAVSLANEVKVLHPTDLHLLQTVMYVYRNLGLHQDIKELYESAYHKHPGKEEMAAHYFMALVRLQDFKSAQMTALKMQKTFKQDKYMFWAIMSIYLQAKEQSEKDPKSPNILINLAERMMQKAATEKRITNFEGLL